MVSCPTCGGRPEVGALCAACAGRVIPCEGLLPDHMSSGAARDAATAWLIDGYGRAHALAPGRLVVGRRPPADVLVLNASVSREHAELSDGGREGWRVRDLGSRNGTQVDGHRVQGRAALPEKALLRVGDVSFWFVAGATALPEIDLRSVATAHAADSGAFRFTVRGAAVELCLVGTRSQDTTDGAGGALLHRAADAPSWRELSLPPLEFQLLRVLCARALEEGDSPSRARGCVPTRQLAKDLPFQSRYANEENVRQVVRRLRTTLAAIGAADLVEAVPGRGYYVTWSVGFS